MAIDIYPGKYVQLELGLDPAHPLILAYPAIFEARAYQGGTSEPGEPRFSAMLLMPNGHPEASLVYETSVRMAEVNWPSQPSEPGKPPQQGVVTRDPQGNIVSLLRTKGMFSWCWDLGDEYADRDANKRYEAFRGHFILKAGSDIRHPPGLGIEMGGDQVFDIPLDDTRSSYKDKFFPGAHVWARIGMAPRKQGGLGITAYLNVVTSYGTGTRNAGFGSDGGGQSASSVRAAHRGIVRPGSPMGPVVAMSGTPAATVAPFPGVRY